MKRTNILRSSGIALAAITLSAGLAACAEEEPAAGSGGDSSQSDETTEEDPSEDTAARRDGPRRQPVRPGLCRRPDVR